jgi:hypothetical protein
MQAQTRGIQPPWAILMPGKDPSVLLGLPLDPMDGSLGGIDRDDYVRISLLRLWHQVSGTAVCIVGQAARLGILFRLLHRILALSIWDHSCIERSICQSLRVVVHLGSHASRTPSPSAARWAVVWYLYYVTRGFGWRRRTDYYPGTKCVIIFTTGSFLRRPLCIWRLRSL